MTTRLYLIAALPVALAHATPTQARRVHAYYIAGIKQPEIARREGIHSSKVSVAIHRGLRNMRRCYDAVSYTHLRAALVYCCLIRRFCHIREMGLLAACAICGLSRKDF